MMQQAIVVRRMVRLGGWFVFDIAVLFLALEVALRIYPILIPSALLTDYPPALRSAIAQRVGLSRAADTVPMVRTDGGPPLNVYRPHTVISHRFEDAGAVSAATMDAAGFCNPGENPTGPAEGGIVVIGDSVVWCTGVHPEDAFAARLGTLIGQPTYNVSMLGAGPYEYVELAKHFAAGVRPRAVAMVFYEGNDMRDVIAFDSYRAAVAASGGTGVTDAPCSLPRAACPLYRFVKNGWLGQSSYAFNLVRNAVRAEVAHATTFVKRAIAREPQGEPINFRYRVAVADGRAIAFNTGNLDLDEVEYARLIVGGGADLARISPALEAFQDQAEAGGFGPMLVYLPSAYTAYGDAATFEDPEVGATLRAASARQREFLAKESQRLGIRFLDLTPALGTAAAGAEETLYFPVNVHLTSFGHAIAAEAIARFMQEQGLLR